MVSRALMNNGQKAIHKTLFRCTLFLPDFSDFSRSIWSEIKALSGKTTTKAFSVVSVDLYPSQLDVAVSQADSPCPALSLDLIKRRSRKRYCLSLKALHFPNIRH